MYFCHKLTSRVIADTCLHEMSQKLIGFSKLNYVKNFNFFFSNLKKDLFLDQNFISNVTLIRKSNYGAFLMRRYQTRNQTLKTTGACSTGERKLSKFTGRSSAYQESDTLATRRKGNVSLKEYKPSPFKIVPKQINNRLNEKISPKKSIGHYLKLTKPNLTILVTLSSICSYAISPNSLSVAELVYLTIGTALCSGSANAINMGREPEFDKRMHRTSLRPVVTGKITPRQAYIFASMCGLLGTSILYTGVNEVVAILGLANIILYGWIYTSLKRRSIVNTWVGAIVGAIPPLMGWAASTSLSHPGGWCLAALLYAWQFPHFNSLSHNIADQYKKAGYVMTAAEDPKLNARVALRYSLLMFPICFCMSYFGVTDWVFAIDSSVANFWLTLLAFRFWRQQRANYKSPGSPTSEGITAANIQARKLFWCSVWQLPVVLVLAMLHKKNQWDRLWKYFGMERECLHEGRINL